MGTKTIQIRCNQRSILDPTRTILVAISSDLVIVEMSHASLRAATLGVNTEPPTATASLCGVTFTWHIARALILFGTPVE